jgi:signal transduction histidine kinase/HAMP domain-containing protein
MPALLRSMSFRWRMVFAMLALSLITAAGFAVLSYWTARNVLEHEAFRAVGIAAASRERSLAIILEEHRDRLREFLDSVPADCPRNSGTSETSCLTKALQELATNEGAVTATLRRRGRPSVTVGYDPREIEEVDGGSPSRIAKLERGTEGRSASFTVEAATADQFVALRLGINEIMPIFLDRTGLGESGESFLTDEDGYFVTPHKYPSESGISHPIDVMPMERCLAGEDGEMVAIDYRSWGPRVIHGFRHVEASGGCIMAHLDEQEAFAPVYSLRRRLFLIGLGSAGAGVLLSLLLSRGLTRSLSALADTATAMRSGDFDAAVPAGGPAEVRAFARSFSAMAQAIRQNRQGLALLAEAGEVLGTSLDYDQTLANVATLATRSIADWCLVDLADGGTIRRLHVAAKDPQKQRVADELGRIPIDRLRPHLSMKTLATWRSVLLPDLASEYVDSLAQSDEHRRILREVRATSLISVPLISRNTLLGSIVFLSSGRRYDERDLRVAEDLARRASAAIDNARLYWEAQTATQARDELLGIVAHDLRTPLTAIVFSANLLVETQGKNAHAERIVRSAERMDRIINDLLDVTKIESGHLSLVRSAQSPRDLLAEAIEAARPVAAEHEIRLDLEAGLPPVLADRDRVLQVFSNLIGNAAKFTDPTGRITVGAGQRGGEVCFRVSDTGPGIAEADLPRVFDRFWQATKADRRGAGLGLPICKGIVEAHGGRIWAESRVGAGSTFYFTLPMAPSTGTSPSFQSISDPSSGHTVGSSNES